MLIVGIDPGLSGAIATLDDGVFEAVTDTPTVEITVSGKQRRQYDIHAMRRAIEETGWRDHRKVMFVLEAQQPMGRDGAKAAFSTGYGFAAWRTLLACLEVPHLEVRSQQWKQTFGLLKKEKHESLVLARQLFPRAADRLKFKCNHGRADAMLIAEFGRRLVDTRGS